MTDKEIQKLIGYLSDSDRKGTAQKLVKFQLYGNQMFDTSHKILGPSGLMYITDNLRKFAKDFNINYTQLCNVLQGRIKQARGFSKG
ncbi:hypothetical protein [Photobacterium halotolerans]|uniref:Uncharacterized protein n=1 Tax=Photobacterium halotolerans TaxID=265726 RepID=A0A0F5V920_9GAMM|nr:hypothetical protein [Photobacterium halotolerans]KKC98613.1 hypothetical protein KY46_17835 [Photobacterium halotolerans]